MSAQLNPQDVDRVLNNLTRVLESIEDRKTRKQIMARAAKPIIIAAKKETPVRDAKWPAKTNRYSAGKIIATYWRGNLRRSIGQLALRRAVRIVMGPKFSKNTRGDFKGRKVDGYYAQFLFKSAAAFRRKVMEKALASTQGQAIQIASREIARLVPKLAKKYGFTTQ